MSPLGLEESAHRDRDRHEIFTAERYYFWAVTVTFFIHYRAAFASR